MEQAAWQAAAGGGKIPIRAARALQSLNDFNQEALDKSHGWWELTGLPSADILDAENEEEPAAETVTLTEELSGGEEENGLSETTRPTYVYNGQTSMGARATKGYRGQIDQAVKELGQYLNAGWQVIVSCSGRGLASRFAANLSEAGLPARAVATLATSSDIEKGSVLVTAGKIAAGFTLKASHLLILAEADLTGRSPRLAQAPRKLASRRGKTIVDPLSLKPGDYVVHSQHGVGRFVQMTKRTIGKGQDAVTREYLVLEYAPSRRGQAGDRLYVPTDSLDLVSRYAGSDTPQLNKMGEQIGRKPRIVPVKLPGKSRQNLFGSTLPVRPPKDTHSVPILPGKRNSRTRSSIRKLLTSSLPSMKSRRIWKNRPLWIACSAEM